MKFEGKGYLVGSSMIKENVQGALVERYKYFFLVGDKENGFLLNPSLHSCMSDTPLLTGKETLFSEVLVEVSIETAYIKDGDRGYKRQQYPTYKLIDVNKKD